MNNQIMISELSNFFKKFRKSLVLLTILFTVIIFGGSIGLSYLNSSNTDEELPISDTKESNPGIFRMYVEQEDGTIYINSMIIEEYMLLPDVLEKAEKETGVEITDVLLEEVRNDFQKTQYDRGALGLSRNGSTHIFTFIANVGTEEENLKVSEFFYDYILSGEINMLDNKLVYIVSEPEIYDSESFAASDIEAIPEFSGEESFNLKNLVLTLVGSVIAAVMLAILITIAKIFSSKKITYAFSYSVADRDRLILLNDNTEKNLMRMLHNEKNPVILLSEFEIEETLKNKIDNVTKAIYINDLNELDTDVEITTPYIFVEREKTTKKWYKKQFKAVHLYCESITILHK